MTSNASGGADAFVYLGEAGPEVPRDVVRVRIDPSIVAIPARAFQYLDELEEVEFHEGLRAIGEEAFSHCRRLRRITIPPAVEEISTRAFGECSLEEVELHEGLREIGEEAFVYCMALRRIRIPSTVEVISDGAFFNCESLDRVDLSEGHRVIEECAFASCRSLRHVVLPSSVRRICDSSFTESESLSSLYLPDDLEHLGKSALFSSGLVRFRVPPLISSIEDYLLYRSKKMFSVELPISTSRIGRHVFEVCDSLRNIAIPPNVNVQENCFSGCISLGKLFGSESEIIEALKGRFEGLPIHRVLYYQSHHHSAVEEFDRTSNMRSGHPGDLRSERNPTGNQQDCLGMTPLHILACSAKQNIELCRLVIEKYPENLVIKDRWGALPILYLLWGNDIQDNMQTNELWEIITLFAESYQTYRTAFPNFDLDWTEMIKSLALGNANKIIIQNFAAMQRTFFSDQIIDWSSVIYLLEQIEPHYDYLDITSETFWAVIRCSMDERLGSIGLRRLRDNFEREFDNIASKYIDEEKDTMDRLPTIRRTQCENINSKLADYKFEFEKLKETTTILEMALWKVKLQESDASTGLPCRNCSESRNEIRIMCGANYVIKNVLPFLLPESLDE